MDTIMIIALIMCILPFVTVFIWIWWTRYYFIIFRTPHWSIKLLDSMRQVAAQRFSLDEDIDFKKYGKYNKPNKQHQVIEIGNIKLVYYDVGSADALEAKHTEPFNWDKVQPAPQVIKRVLENKSMYSLLSRRVPRQMKTNDILFIVICAGIACAAVYYFTTHGGFS